jgi:hypothetical protein
MPVPPQSKTAKRTVKMMDLQSHLDRRRRLGKLGMDYYHEVKPTDLKKSGKQMRLPKTEIIDGSGPWKRKRNKS